MIRLKKYLLLLVFLFLTYLSYGQRARLFSTDSEISNSLVGDIHQDHKGNIWIATDDGINRYDGSKFTTYKEKEGVLSKNARLIFEDSQHNLFFGYPNGLQIYDHASDSFEVIPFILGNNTRVSAYVQSMLERKDGTLLIGTSGFGIFSISMEKGKAVAHQLPELVPSPSVNYLFEDSNQALWVSTQDKGLFRIENGERTKNYFDARNGLNSNITSICQDSKGRLFVGSLSKGLFRYDEESDNFQQISHKAASTLPVKVLHPMQNNELLIGTDGKGTKLYNPITGQLTNYDFNVSNFDFSKSKVHAIEKDNKGNLWLGLYQRGVALIPAQINGFNYIGYRSVTNNIIGSNYVMSVYKDHEDMLWVGTDGDGLYKISPEGKQLAHYASDTAPSTIMCIYEDSENNLWIGSYLNGLARLNRATGEFEYVKNMLNAQFNPVQRTINIVEDLQKNLWIGTLGYGLYSLNLTSGKIKNFDVTPNPAHPNNAKNKLHNSWIYCLLISEEEKLYIGTAEGISCLDLKTETFISLNDIYPDLEGQSVKTLHQDTLGRIWIGTSQGLMCLNPKKQIITTYTMDDGLPGEVICAIENDKDQNLWISTHYGISKFNPNKNTFSNYFFQDGLQGNEFSKRAAFRDNDGSLFFGGINGITFFRPEEISDNARDLDLAMTGFYIQGTAVKKGMKSGKHDIINKAVMDADSFRLSYEDNSFSIELSAFEYMNPERVTYLYSMNDGNWVDLQQGINTVTFSNLDPGTYSLKVKAKDFSTYSNVKEILVVVHPAWYFSAWAKAGYFLLAVMIITGVIFHIRQRLHARNRIREHQYAKQINEAKLEFFTNIAHEIRTPLSLILNPLKKLITNDPDANRQEAYKVMRRNTERTLHLVNQLMDLRQMDKGKISLRFRETDILKFIEKTIEIFEEQTKEKHIHVQVYHEPDVPGIWIDQNFFDKVILNVFSNAIKFTPKYGKIRLHIEPQKVVGNDGQIHPHLKIICSDSGIGLNESETEKVFDRFYQGTNNQYQSAGNGIGLHLTRSIVELHHGTVHAKNNQNGVGCQFIISIPLGKAHLKAEELVSEPVETELPTSKIQIIPPLSLEDSTKTGIKSKSKKRVLVVDDNEDIRRYICSELGSDYHVQECSNGKEALAFALQKEQDLIISDVVMPEMDGITLCRKIRQNVNLNHIPVILLTAKSKEEDYLKGLGIGADAYIVKPFNIEILKKTVQNIIRNRDILKNNYMGSQQQGDKVRKVNLTSPDESLLNRVIDVINENLGNTELNVEMLSREVGISRVHLHRKLKELTNQTTSDFIRNIRLQQAAELLSGKPMNISEVAFAVGFSKIAHFSGAFRELYGMSPTAYVETHLKQKDESL